MGRRGLIRTSCPEILSRLGLRSTGTVIAAEPDLPPLPRHKEGVWNERDSLRTLDLRVG